MPSGNEIGSEGIDRLTHHALAILADIKTRGREVPGAEINRASGDLLDLLRSPEFRPDDETYYRFAGHLPEISSLLALSPDIDADAELSRAMQGKVDRYGLRRALLLLSPHTRLTLNVEMLARGAPMDMAAVAAGFLSCRVVMTPEGEELRRRILECGPLFAGLTPPDSLMERFCNAWMFCSYAETPDRHEFKAALNAMFSNWWASKGVPEEQMPVERPVRTRPRVVVVTEIIKPGHAMHRCFEPALKALRSFAETIGFGDRLSQLPAASDLFDETVIISKEITDLPKTAARLAALEPDMVYWPSCGMRGWSVMLANRRFAPVQFMSIGHPATTRSPHMDFVVGGTATIGPEGVFSETGIQLRRLGNVGIAQPTLGEIKAVIRQNPETLRIAVDSRSFKINAGFLDCCREIAARASRPVCFDLFPNEQPFTSGLIEKLVGNMLHGLTIYRTLPYRDYIDRLAASDIRLGTFPFGGANTNIDCMLLGIPSVIMLGDEPAARTDMRYQKLSPLPDWLTATSREEFVKAALHLIDDDALRVGLSRELAESDPANRFYREEHEQFPDDFPETVRWMWENRDALKSSERKIWRVSDREAIRNP
jgi:hypothetical protein